MVNTQAMTQSLKKKKSASIKTSYDITNTLEFCFSTLLPICFGQQPKTLMAAFLNKQLYCFNTYDFFFKIPTKREIILVYLFRPHFSCNLAADLRTGWGSPADVWLGGTECGG